MNFIIGWVWSVINPISSEFSLRLLISDCFQQQGHREKSCLAAAAKSDGVMADSKQHICSVTLVTIRVSSSHNTAPPVSAFKLCLWLFKSDPFRRPTRDDKQVHILPRVYWWIQMWFLFFFPSLFSPRQRWWISWQLSFPLALLLNFKVYAGEDEIQHSSLIYSHHHRTNLFSSFHL